MKKAKKKHGARLWVQALWAALTNGYVAGFVEGKIYSGPLKAVCVPGLNCYACPGALGSCPIGSLQATLGARQYQIAFYVFGFLMVVGAFLGRFVCGWLCPFGLLQDLLYKIPFVKKLKSLPGDRVLKWLKYVVLALFVILLPMFAVNPAGGGDPWFCKYICPSGTLSGGLLILGNQALTNVLGFLFAWKWVLLGITVLLSILVYRPFCRYICPLGAIYGFFNRIALYRLRVDTEKCTRCGLCQKTCKLDIPVWKRPNSAECIRCGDCIRVCPTGAITSTFARTPKPPDPPKVEVKLRDGYADLREP